MQYETDFIRAKGLDNDETFGTVEPVTEEKKDMIDFELVDKENAVQHIDHKIEEIIEASVALEEYTKILKDNARDGVSKQTTKAMLVGLRQIDRIIGVRSEFVASLENETGTGLARTNHEKSSVSEGGLLGKAKELWNKFVELIKRGLEKLKNIAVKIKNKMTGVGKQVEDAKSTMNDYNPNGPTGGRKVTVPIEIAQHALDGTTRIDLDDNMEFFKWSATVIIPMIKKGVEQIKALKGTETPEEILELMPKDIPQPNAVPANVIINLDGHVFDIQFKEVTEEPTIPVLSKDERRKTVDKVGEANYLYDKYDNAIKSSFDDILTLMDMDFTLSFKVGEQFRALQQVVAALNGLGKARSGVNMAFTDINYATMRLLSEEGK